MTKLLHTLGPRPTSNTTGRERLILLFSVVLWGLSTGSPAMRPDAALDEAALAASVHVDDAPRHIDSAAAPMVITAVPTE